MSEDDLLEKDIWKYKSIRKQKPTSQHSEVIATKVQKATIENGKSQRNDNRNGGKPPKGKGVPKKKKQSPRQRSNQTPLKPGVSIDDPIEPSQEGLSTTLAKETKICERQNTAKARPIFEGYCPSCQMPFSLLLIQTPQWHVTECLDASGTAEKGTVLMGSKNSSALILKTDYVPLRIVNNTFLSCNSVSEKH